MDTVYVLMQGYFDGCDFFKTFVDVYRNEDDAIFEKLRLEEELGDDIQEISWDVIATPLK